MAKVSVSKIKGFPYDNKSVLAAVRDALSAWGGISYFIKQGQKVFIKPNAVTNVGAQHGVTTEPAIIAAIVQLAYEAGAEQVVVGDSSVNWSNSYEVMRDLGIVKEVTKYGGRVVNLDDEQLVVIDIPKGEAIRQIQVPRPLVEADVIVDVPKAKVHMIDGITCCIKNWVGVIPQRFRLSYHQMPRLIQVVADLFSVLRPTLCVVDALVIGEGEGPLNVEPRFVGAIVAGDDPVATDVVVAELMGITTNELWFPWAAFLAGIGEIDRRRIELYGIPLESLKIQAQRPIPALFNRFPCNVVAGGVCWGCLTWFIGTAVSWERDGTWVKIQQRLGKPTFVLGFKAQDPAMDEHLASGPYFVVGDCALVSYKKESADIIEIPGCPPGPTLVEAVHRLLGEGKDHA